MPAGSLSWFSVIPSRFIRKWDHTRSKKVQSVSLERFREKNQDTDDDRLFYVPDPRLHLEEYVCARAHAERFLKSLPWKERRIIQMRDEGYSYMEIAAEHSIELEGNLRLIFCLCLSTVRHFIKK